MECLFSPEDLAIIGQGATSLALAAVDEAGNKSAEVKKAIQIATLAAAPPQISTISVDNRINATEAKAGVYISGKAEANSLVKMTLGANSFSTKVNQYGSWDIQLRSTDLPGYDGAFDVSVTATNGSGLESRSQIQTLSIDRNVPLLLSQTVSGNKLQLRFSKDLNSASLAIGSFKVLENEANITVLQALISTTNSKVVELTLGRTPAASSSLKTTYVAQSNGPVIRDVSGNTPANFSQINAETYSTATSVTNLAASYSNLELLGTASISGVGNALANSITGNSGANILHGGSGGDTLTGLGGKDTFRYTNLLDSLLTQYDRISDLVIGFDQIDGPTTVLPSNVRQLGAVAALSQSAIQQVLTTNQFVANGAATFTFSSRTFLAINDSTAGFNASRDGVIEITGYSGNLNQLGIA